MGCFYAANEVENGKTNKHCDNCGKIIKKGTHHWVIPYKFVDSIVLCDDCNDELYDELGDDIEALFKKLGYEA